jgi:hypothetical protein
MVIVSPIGQSSGYMEPHSAHFAGEIRRGAPVLAYVLVIADEDHGADPGVLQPDDRQDGIAAEQAESRIGQAVTEVRIVLPRAGLVHERERDRQCSHCPGLRWHPARVISSHPRSITPAEPTRLGTPGAIGLWCLGMRLPHSRPSPARGVVPPSPRK